MSSTKICNGCGARVGFCFDDPLIRARETIDRLKAELAAAREAVAIETLARNVVVAENKKIADYNAILQAELSAARDDRKCENTDCSNIIDGNQHPGVCLSCWNRVAVENSKLRALCTEAARSSWLRDYAHPAPEGPHCLCIRCKLKAAGRGEGAR